MKVTELNKTTLKGIREAINLSLESARKLTGLDLRLGNCTYTDNNFNFKLKGALINKDGVAETQERMDFKTNAVYYGLTPRDLDREFTTFSGNTYIISGAKPRATKYPILAKRKTDGKGFKFPATAVKFALEK